jgi:methyltransferase
VSAAVWAGCILVVVGVTMAAETALSFRHARVLLAAGAVEPRDDVYGWMSMTYPACFVAMIAEGVWRGVGPDRWLIVGAVTLALAKAVKYWAIWSLGPRWTFRVLVPPSAPLVTRGPYRFLRHPNYVAVMGEILGVALLCKAILTGSVSLLGFGALLQRRVAVEERALGLR